MRKQQDLQRQKELQERQELQRQAELEQNPLKFTNWELSTYRAISSKAIRVGFVCENISDSKIYLSFSSFSVKKEGQNVVHPFHDSGGFSDRVEKPIYTKRSYDLYPGDKVAVSLDFWTDEKDMSVEGWKLYFEHGGKFTQILSMRD